MSRSKRDEFVPERFYHFYNRSADHKSIFLSDEDYRYFIERYKHYFHSIFETYAYCVMKNHFHFIIKVKSEESIRLYAGVQSGNNTSRYINYEISLDQYLSDQLRRFFSSVSIKFNNLHNRKGQVFARFPKRVFIENEDRLRFLIAYVHHNPIHHKFSNNFTDWKYSSYKTFLSKKETHLSKAQVLELYRGVEKFQQFHNNYKSLNIKANST